MSISSWDDFPVHQTAEYIRHAATSDRNFYDRYYFNLHGSSDELFAIFGLGQYPNLGVADAFISVRRGDRQHIVRASKELTDRREIGVGPIRIEVEVPLQRVRVVVEPTEHDVAMDVTWQAAIPAFEEPRQYIRSRGKVVFDTQRFAQLGRWQGTLNVAGETIEVTPDRWGGSRDRSWGVRPVGEPEPDGIRQGINVMAGMWNYFPVDFGDHAIVYMCHETPEGDRMLEEGVRVWPDPERAIEHLGRPEWHHTMIPGTRLLSDSVIRFPEAPGGLLEMRAEPVLTNFISVGTGYGMDSDWRHGMYQGLEVVQGLTLDVEETRGLGQYGVVDSVGRFTYGDQLGWGLYEHGFFGPFAQFGLVDGAAVAP